jgi:pimeloyl-ACP methyl ester carboxylesterase
MDEILHLGRGMFGLLSQPAGVPHSTAVVVLNAGFIHRSGPFRLGTRLARALAAAGYPALRFDLPGIGDTLPGADRPLVEVVAGVLDRLQARTGCARVVVGGICAAADLGWQAALRDARIDGVFLLDGPARGRFWFNLARARRLLRKSPAHWLAAVRRLRAPPADVTDAQLRDWPARGSEPAQLDRLRARGVQLLMLFTGGTAYFLHPRQLRATFGRGVRSEAVAIEYWPECDHTYSLEAHRQRLIDCIGTWVASRFPD